MSKIVDIDKNLKVDAEIDKTGLKFYDANSEPFKIYGVSMQGGKFRRLPESVAKSVSDGVYALHANTAGGRVRFRTDSTRIAIHAKMENVAKFPHCAITGTCGFDLYVKDETGDNYRGTFPPPLDLTDGYEGMVGFDMAKMREITINMPTYSDVTELYIGLLEDANLEAPTPYKTEQPIVYYGSSITQGGCAIRPGITYQSYIARRFDWDYINLGFSGSAKAEEEMVEYICGLDMKVFVYDYDHNAPTPEYLAETHEKMYKAVRAAKPDTPIIMMNRPKFTLNNDDKRRLAVVEQTYNNAIAAGDKNLYFIRGTELMKYAGDEGTVDNCHPNDLGFASMAKVLGDFIEVQELYK